MSASLFDRLLARPRKWWVILLISLVLLLLPFGAASLDGVLPDFLDTGKWHVYLVAPSVIIYFLIVSPVMGAMGANVLHFFRPLVQLDDEQFENLVARASKVTLAKELIAFGIGTLLAPFMTGLFRGPITWLWVCAFIASSLMYGSLALTIYISLASTRTTSMLHKQPLKFDLFDSTPFAIIGRQSLGLVLVFIGGITLSLVLTFQPENLRNPGMWLGNIPLVMIALLIFFLNMLPTHRLLAGEKASNLKAVQDHIHSLGAMLLQKVERSEDTGGLAAQISALAVYEQHIQNARTWPYDTRMLRTLFFSAFVPGVTMLGRMLIEYLFPSGM
jgi:hypothetical protein